MQSSSRPTFHFEPEIAGQLSGVFEAVWSRLRAAESVYAQPYLAEETRERIAFKIIELAAAGERDVSKLIDRALNDFAVLPRTAESQSV